MDLEEEKNYPTAWHGDNNKSNIVTTGLINRLPEKNYSIA